MKIAYFNCSSGISGDMLIASLIQPGISVPWLKGIINMLGLGNIHANVRKIERNHLPAFSVRFTGGKRMSPAEMAQKIKRMPLAVAMRKKAQAILSLLIEAESFAHQQDPHAVHFHQLSEPDTLIDIITSVAAMDKLGIEQVVASPVNAGSPAPAAMYIIKKAGIPVYADQHTFKEERMTPTGAAIIAGIGTTYGTMPVMQISSYGFGAGEHVFPHGENILKVFIGMSKDSVIAGSEKIFLVETNIDDMDSRAYPYVIEKLLEAGAYDAWLTPVQMKKGRPAITVHALCSEDKMDAVRSVLLFETTTLGIRFSPMQRWCLPRWKKGMHKFGVYKNSIKKNVELDDAVKMAEKQKKPLYEILKK